jgi:hypothetical protein
VLSVSAPVASLAVIITRVCTLWFAVAVGVPFVLRYLSRSPEARATWSQGRFIS